MFVRRVDLDWLMWFDMPGVDDAASERIFLANLADVVATYRDAGVEHLVMAGAVVDRRSLDLIASAIVVPLSVVLLKVPIDVIDGRLRADPRTQEDMTFAPPRGGSSTAPAPGSKASPSTTLGPSTSRRHDHRATRWVPETSSDR